MSERSIWHALPVSMDPQALAGHTLTGVSSSWHEFEGQRSPEPVHICLSLEGLGSVRLHTFSGLLITQHDGGAPFDMAEYGRIVVDDTAPAPLNDCVGRSVERVSRLDQNPPGAAVGMVLHFHDRAVGIADLGDELVVAEWPNADWAQWGVTIKERD